MVTDFMLGDFFKARHPWESVSSRRPTLASYDQRFSTNLFEGETTAAGPLSNALNKGILGRDSRGAYYFNECSTQVAVPTEVSSMKRREVLVQRVLLIITILVSIIGTPSASQTYYTQAQSKKPKRPFRMLVLGDSVMWDKVSRTNTSSRTR